MRDTGAPAESPAVLARHIAGDGSALEKTRRLIDWSQTNLAWTSTDYVRRTPEEVLARRGGNCAELASVLAFLLESIDLRVRWVAELNVQPRSDRRQRDAEAIVREKGARASVFGRRHNDHRWLEIYDPSSEEWFPADPSVGVAGVSAWEAARLGFGARPHSPVPAVAATTREMLVPFAVMTLDSERRAPVEDRSVHYLVEQFDRYYGGRLSRLPAWPEWVAAVQELSAAALEAFRGTRNLHRMEPRIVAVEQIYRRLERQAAANRIRPEAVPDVPGSTR